MLSTPNLIENPFVRGQRVTLPAGTAMRSMNPADTQPRVLKRAVSVKVHSVSHGYVDTYGDNKAGRGFVVLPTICYPGPANYWQYVPVTEAVCEANDVPMPALPAYTEAELARLDTVPSYGPGYDDRPQVA